MATRCTLNPRTFSTGVDYAAACTNEEAKKNAKPIDWAGARRPMARSEWDIVAPDPRAILNVRIP